MSDFKCPMCTDCPDNCPLDTEEDTREYSADYYEGKADGAREFLVWYSGGETMPSFGRYAKCNIDDVIAEWQKGI